MYAFPGVTPDLQDDDIKKPLGENGEVPLLPGEIPLDDLTETPGEL